MTGRVRLGRCVLKFLLYTPNSCHCTCDKYRRTNFHLILPVILEVVREEMYSRV